MFRNPFQVEGNWYKAGLHTHTIASDGQATLEERVEQYRSHGYSVLAITDHGVVSDAMGHSTDGFLMLDGIEITLSPFDDERFYHLLCLNVPCDLTFPGGREPNVLIEYLKDHGAESFIAHPYWSSNTHGELALLRGHAGIEVFNAGCQNIGRAFSSVHWDNMLAAGLQPAAIAVDDVHSARGPLDLFGGWTMLKMTELSVPAVMAALGTGCYYSSSGAEILDFRVQNGTAHLRCKEAREIHFMAVSWHGRSLYAGDGPLLTDARVDVDEDWKYVRAEVVDVEGKCAWTNPIFL